METAKLEILADICERFNEEQVKYVVCGAFAGKLHGIEEISKQFRPTKDYDFIIDGSKENVKKIKAALKDLFTKIEDLQDDEFEEYTTIQVVEEKNDLVLDLIKEMWGMNYSYVIKDAVIIELKDVKIPVISINNLLCMKKNSFRPQDRFDIYWLTKIKGRKK